jgi:hypothetical protein
MLVAVACFFAAFAGALLRLRFAIMVPRSLASIDTLLRRVTVGNSIVVRFRGMLGVNARKCRRIMRGECRNFCTSVVMCEKARITILHHSPSCNLILHDHVVRISQTIMRVKPAVILTCFLGSSLVSSLCSMQIAATLTAHGRSSLR